MFCNVLQCFAGIHKSFVLRGFDFNVFIFCYYFTGKILINCKLFCNVLQSFAALVNRLEGTKFFLTFATQS